ncbi:dimethylarginine dimethylaminohydrolase family protein [Acidobacteriota bacterium]
MKISCPDETGILRHVLLKHPREAFLSGEAINKQWKSLNYSSPPDLEESFQEYEEFVRILEEFKILVDFLPEDRRTGLDSLYVRDAAVVTSRGIVLGSMGKQARSREVEALEAYLRHRQIPVLGRITGEGRLEGGDVVRLDSDTLAVGLGYRTNREGISQLAEITQGFCREIIEVPLPHWDGPKDVLHLMSFISPLAPGTALIYSRMMPVFFRQILIERGFELIEVTGPEFDMMACNVLALAPGKCLMLDGCPQTKALIEKNGIEVLTYSGKEISRKGAGGPTCLTLPLFRE